MPDVIPGSILWSAAAFLGVVVLLLFVGGPIAIYFVVRVDLNARTEVHHPDDPTLPNAVRWFFHETWTQFGPLGFEPRVYLSIHGLTSNLVSYIALFDHPINKDGAAAMVAAPSTTNGPQLSSYVAEFCTYSADGIEVSTNNDRDTDGLYALRHKHVRKLLQMRDLAQLYEAHKLHMRDVGMIRKRDAVPAEEQANQLTAEMLAEFEAQVAVRCLRRYGDGRLLRMGVPAAIVMTWKQIPPISHMGRMLLRRRAAKWLSDHDLPARYDEIDYRKHVCSQIIPSGILPVPDWYMPEATESPVDVFLCLGCGQDLKTNETVGSFVQCPICHHMMTVPMIAQPSAAITERRDHDPYGFHGSIN
ncbi:MAG: hypothetical protein H6818_10655 [Phycisphaerales bacterium]|nr:hypothetical protein [Phycisphaerales bacterium]